MIKFEYDNVAPVKTKCGFVKGYKVDGTHVFKGIPYASAKRFQMPTEVEAWEGVKETTSYGRVCPLLMEDNPSGELLVPHMYWPQHEDCQSLNIWTQHINDDNKKPVLVWLHGGGFFAGSSIEQLAYEGENLSKKGDVVVVTINHRLNILGFMDLSPFGDKYKNSANAGFADMVAALRWVKDNISEFGGDPDNVTIFGQSGGGMKVSALMQIPEASDLFHKGVIMSGVAGDFMPPYKDVDGREIVNALLKELNFANVEELETVSFNQLAQAYGKVAMPLQMQGVYVGNNPRVDDYYLGEPQVFGFSEKAKNTPIMIGSVFGEFSFANNDFDKNELSEEQQMAILSEVYKENTEKVVTLFKEAYPNNNVMDVLSIDTLFRPLKSDYINAKSKYTEAPTYSYMFNLEFPVNHGKTAWHCSDIPFFFNNTEKVPSANIEGVSDILEDQISSALVSFAYTVNPNHEGLPEWKASTEGSEYTMIFDKNNDVKVNFDYKLIALLKEILPPFSFEALMSEDIQH